jgi:hypothetical protein
MRSFYSETGGWGMYRDSASRVLEDLAGMRIHAKAGMRSLQHVLKKLTMQVGDGSTRSPRIDA